MRHLLRGMKFSQGSQGIVGPVGPIGAKGQHVSWTCSEQFC